MRAELPRLYRVAVRLTGRAGEAEDLVAQTLLNAAAAWEGFDGRYPVAWLLRIMNNAYLRRREVESRTIQVPLDHTHCSREPGPYRHVEAMTTLEQVIGALNRLSPEHRMAITLCDIEEMPYQEIAVALGVPVGTISSRLYRARRALQTACADIGLEAP